LNRVVQWCENETRHKADQAYADIIVRDLVLKGNSKSVVTPGVKGEIEKGDDCDEELEGEEAAVYRAAVARGIYLAQDRSDIGFAVKELNRKMAKPTRGDQATLKTLKRYLLRVGRVIRICSASGTSEWTNTDYAGCKRTRKSTSEGVVKLGTHSQAIISLSSGEAEYYGLVKGGCIGRGARALLGDRGVRVRVKLKTDASGIASRNGLGKVRHIEVNQLRLQEEVGSDHSATGEPAERRAQRRRLKGEQECLHPGESCDILLAVLPGSGEGSDTDKQCGDNPLQSGDAATNATPSSGDSPKNRGEPIKNEIQGEREDTRTISTEMLCTSRRLCLHRASEPHFGEGRAPQNTSRGGDCLVGAQVWWASSPGHPIPLQD
jgi:hypothetical protein